MIDPTKPKDLQRLRGAIRHSNRQLTPHLQQRKSLINTYVGDNYGVNRHNSNVYSVDSGNDATPLPLLNQAKTTYKRRLAGNTPQCLVTTPYTDKKFQAAMIQRDTNALATEIGMQRSLADIVDNALTMVGIRKVGMATTFTQAEDEGFLNEAGQVFFESVDPDDFFVDMTVKRWKKASFMGDWYCVRLEEAKQDERFDKDARSKLQSSPRMRRNEEGFEDVSTVGQRDDPTPEDVEDMVCLGNIWLPKEKLFLTVARDQDELLLSSTQWFGPERGPYDLLFFDPVPSHIIPLAPLTLLQALAGLSNAMYVKLADQGVGQKSIAVGEAGNDADNKTVQNADDGDYVGLNNPNAVKELHLGGLDQPTLAFMLQNNQQYNKMAGNIDIIGGLGAQSETATQDSMLDRNAGTMIQDMEKSTADFVARAFEDMAFYQWVDPDHTMRDAMSIPGTDESVEVTLSPEQRDADDWQYNFTLTPFSLRYRSPEERITLVERLLDRLLPHAQPMQQQGQTVDYARYIELYAEYTGVPEVREVIRSTNPEQPGVPPVGQDATQPANTTRTNVRISTPGATDRGNEQNMQALLLGGTPQDSQRSAMFAPVTQ